MGLLFLPVFWSLQKFPDSYNYNIYRNIDKLHKGRPFIRGWQDASLQSYRPPSFTIADVSSKPVVNGRLEFFKHFNPVKVGCAFKDLNPYAPFRFVDFTVAVIGAPALPVS